MAEAPFQPGDIVELKSGSVPMTVFKTYVGGSSGIFVNCYYAASTIPVALMEGIPAVILQKVDSNKKEASS